MMESFSARLLFRSLYTGSAAEMMTWDPILEVRFLPCLTYPWCGVGQSNIGSLRQLRKEIVSDTTKLQ